MRELVIIGAGPAGLTAAIYASRAGIDVLVCEGGMYGGQLVYNSSYNKNGRDERQNRYLNVGDKALRSRYFWEKDLVIGDIFMMRGSTTMYLYIYVGNDTFVILNGTSAFKTTSVSTRFQYAPSSTWKYLAVLRPSFVLDI